MGISRRNSSTDVAFLLIFLYRYLPGAFGPILPSYPSMSTGTILTTRSTEAQLVDNLGKEKLLPPALLPNRGKRVGTNQKQLRLLRVCRDPILTTDLEFNKPTFINRLSLEPSHILKILDFQSLLEMETSQWKMPHQYPNLVNYLALTMLRSKGLSVGNGNQDGLASAFSIPYVNGTQGHLPQTARQDWPSNPNLGRWGSDEGFSPLSSAHDSSQASGSSSSDPHQLPTPEDTDSSHLCAEVASRLETERCKGN